MRLQNSTIHGMLGAVILTMGLATSMSLAAEEPSSEAETVEVRINLPDGSTVVQRSKKDSSRVNLQTKESSAHQLNDGSRISVGSSSSSSGKIRSRGARSATRKGTQSSAPATTHRVVVNARQNQASQSPEAEPVSNTSDSVATDIQIPTVGAAQHDGNTAFGGQTVNFAGTGMYGAVIGRTIYLVGVELAHADQAFEVSRGTRIGNDTVIMDESDFGTMSTARNAIEAKTHLKLTFDSSTVVNLVMYSDPGESDSSTREERIWTVQIR